MSLCLDCSSLTETVNQDQAGQPGHKLGPDRFSSGMFLFLSSSLSLFIGCVI